LAFGEFSTAADALIAGMQLLRERREQFEKLKADIQEGLDQLERGEYHDYDDTTLRQFFDSLKERARQVAIQHNT
jgi:hypothetical protein